MNAELNDENDYNQSHVNGDRINNSLISPGPMKEIYSPRRVGEYNRISGNNIGAQMHDNVFMDPMRIDPFSQDFMGLSELYLPNNNNLNNGHNLANNHHHHNGINHNGQFYAHNGLSNRNLSHDGNCFSPHMPSSNGHLNYPSGGRIQYPPNGTNHLDEDFYN